MMSMKYCIVGQTSSDVGHAPSLDQTEIREKIDFFGQPRRLSYLL